MILGATPKIRLDPSNYKRKLKEKRGSVCAFDKTMGKLLRIMRTRGKLFEGEDIEQYIFYKDSHVNFIFMIF